MATTVAVSLRAMSSADYGEPRDAISHDWVRLFDLLEITPVLVPNSICDPIALVRRLGVERVLLTNGGDVSPLPGEPSEESERVAMERQRDRVERALLDHAVNEGLPVLGVCRGHQAMNSYFGGTLVRDIRNLGLADRAHVGKPHPVTLLAEDPVESLSGQEVMVNSFHNQAVSESSLAPCLRPFAIAKGGLVEGFRHRDLAVFGVQWHPERSSELTDLDRLVLRAWLRRT